MQVAEEDRADRTSIDISKALKVTLCGKQISALAIRGDDSLLTSILIYVEGPEG